MSENKSTRPITVLEMKEQMLKEALRRTSGNRTHAAKLLGISQRTIRHWLTKFGLKEYR